MRGDQWGRIDRDLFDHPYMAARPKDAKLLFIWAMSRRNGVGACAMSVVAAKLGMSQKELAAAIETCAPKVMLVEDRIVVRNWVRRNVDNENYAIACCRAVAVMPSAVQTAWIDANAHYFERMGWAGIELLTPGDGSEPPTPQSVSADPERAARLDAARAKAAAFEAKVQDVFEAWKEAANKPDAKPSKRDLASIRAALNRGCEVADLKLAVMGQRKSPHHMGQNSQGRVFDAIEYAMRETNMGDFIARASGNGAPAKPARVYSPAERAVLFGETLPEGYGMTPDAEGR